MVRKFAGGGIFILMLLASIQLLMVEIENQLPDPQAVPAGGMKDDEQLGEIGIASLEWFLVSREEENGYIIETYREYEVYRKNDGAPAKKEPTDHYEYIRYKN